jgi:uncharacterized short protein YbdD (DUF466 family)
MDSKPAAAVATWVQDVAQAGRYLAQSMRLMVGVPSYDTYLAHMQATHPEQTPMAYEAFFLERQEARYGGAGNGRCC